MVIRISHTGQKYAIMWERYRPGGTQCEKEKDAERAACSSGEPAGLDGADLRAGKILPRGDVSVVSKRKLAGTEVLGTPD